MRLKNTANGLVLMLTFMLPSFCLTGFAGPLQQKMKRCDSGEVRSIKVENELIHTAGTGDAEPGIQVQPRANASASIKVTALGPILGSMDSRVVKTDLRCSDNGIVLKATITRSEHFNGAVLQNQHWRPRIVLTIKPKQQDVTLETIWSMRLTNGKVIDHAQTPPYAERPYPIVVTKGLR